MHFATRRMQHHVHTYTTRALVLPPTPTPQARDRLAVQLGVLAAPPQGHTHRPRQSGGGAAGPAAAAAAAASHLDQAAVCELAARVGERLRGGFRLLAARSTPV